jgi:hypothetical protein
VGSGVVVVREVASQEMAQVVLAQDEDMVETLSPYRADEAFHEGIGQSKRLHTVQTIRAEVFGLPIRSTP